MTIPVVTRADLALALVVNLLSRLGPYRRTAVIDGDCMMSFHPAEDAARSALLALVEHFAEKRLDMQRGGSEPMIGW